MRELLLLLLFILISFSNAEISDILIGEWREVDGTTDVTITFPPAPCKSPQYDIFYVRWDHADDKAHVSGVTQLRGTRMVIYKKLWPGSAYMFRGTVICEDLRKVLLLKMRYPRDREFVRRDRFLCVFFFFSCLL